VQKSKAGPIIAIIAVVLLVLCLGCGGGAWYFFYKAKKTVEDVVNNLPSSGPDAPKNNNNGSTTHTVKYAVTGTGKAQIIYAKGSGGQEVVTVDLPWSQEITVNAKNFGLTVIAVPEKDSTLDGCSITIDGAQKKTGVFQNNTLNCSYVYLG